MSDHPVLKKMQLKPHHRAIVLNAPESYAPVLAAIPDTVDLAATLDGQFDFIHLFATHMDPLLRDAALAKTHLKPGGLFWVSYPKGKALPTDLKRDNTADALRTIGLQANFQIAIDDVWSALRFKQAE
jgi:hypothetical protein